MKESSLAEEVENFHKRNDAQCWMKDMNYPGFPGRGECSR